MQGDCPIDNGQQEPERQLELAVFSVSRYQDIGLSVADQVASRFSHTVWPNRENIESRFVIFTNRVIFIHGILPEAREEAEQHGGFVTILEICGFNDWLVKLLAEYGSHETVLAQTEKKDKHKTDRRDANTLGELLWTNR